MSTMNAPRTPGCDCTLRARFLVEGGTMSLPCPIWSTSSCPPTSGFSSVSCSRLARRLLTDRGWRRSSRRSSPSRAPTATWCWSTSDITLDESGIKFTEQECKHKGLSFVIPIKAKINLVFWGTGEIRQKEIYMGDIPLMTGRGTFIINGAERVVVSQIHRSPGVIFSHEKGAYTSRIIPYRGSWLEFEIDQKKELIYAKIDRKKRLLATIFLRALGFDSREKHHRAVLPAPRRSTIDDSTARPRMPSLAPCVAKAVYRGDRRGTARSCTAPARRSIRTTWRNCSIPAFETVEIIDLDHPGVPAQPDHSQLLRA